MESQLGRPWPSGGFTLIELTVVLVLMAIMAALILPEMKGTFEGERLRASSRQLWHALHLAYSQTVTLNKPHHLRLETSSGRYQVERFGERDHSGTGWMPLTGLPECQGVLDPLIRAEIRPASEAPAFDLDLNAPVARIENSSSGSPDTIAFFPDGTADAREIVLRDRGGFSQILRVNPVTARVKLIPGEPSQTGLP